MSTYLIMNLIVPPVYRSCSDDCANHCAGRCGGPNDTTSSNWLGDAAAVIAQYEAEAGRR